MESAYQETMFLLKKYHINANKKLGQNFLVNDDVIQQAIETAQITKEENLQNFAKESDIPFNIIE